MPMIAVNLSDKIIRDIRELVDKDRYAGLESFIEIAAFNQLALERGATPAEIIERGHRRGPSDVVSSTAHAVSAKNKPSPKKQPSSNGAKKSAAANKSPKLVDAVDPVTEDDSKAAFARLARPAKDNLPVAQPMPAARKTDERIFGQVNRLFPVKLICRWVAFAAAIDRQWPKFTAIAATLADDAGTIGSLLDDWDKSQQRERGGELGTALPRRKNNASLDRFLSQFVARITRASEVSPGAVCQYEFARFQDSMLALTEQGIRFAEMDNPILDAQDQKAVAALSEAEAGFLADHIRAWVPTEWHDMKVVLEVVQSGKASPVEVAAAVRTQLPGGWTDSMVQTHVSGVIARLGDIRLLRRSWQGRNVRYELGTLEHVNQFLRTESEAHA
jgi:DNA-binding transcriptional ArsR family regulator